MDDAGELVWYANDDSRWYVWRGGAAIAALLSVPLLIILCSWGAHGRVTAGGLVVGVGLPVAVGVVTLVNYVRDLRRVVLMRVDAPPGRPARLVLVRAGGRETSHLLAAVTRVDVLREMSLGRSVSSTMVLSIGGYAHTTRPGPGDLPERWTAALTGAGAVVEVHNIYGQYGRPRYRPLRFGRGTRRWRV